ncbi:hypothetical protein [Actibacterium lipolyticum]|uniref:hypothetical protein n=1 Tax=Actibacterium lipolyticum TaxID=1524263 RepID=UPI000BB4568E|nr:hypothetical protein [Actibacterium lipolyticum]
MNRMLHCSVRLATVYFDLRRGFNAISCVWIKGFEIIDNSVPKVVEGHQFGSPQQFPEWWASRGLTGKPRSLLRGSNQEDTRLCLLCSRFFRYEKPLNQSAIRHTDCAGIPSRPDVHRIPALQMEKAIGLDDKTSYVPL